MEPVTEGGDEEQRPQLSSSLQSGGGESTTVQEAAAAITIRAAAIPKETASPNFMGKHRMAAAVAQLHQQIQIVQEELEELETLGEASIVCKELVSAVESVSDALLPVLAKMEDGIQMFDQRRMLKPLPTCHLRPNFKAYPQTPPKRMFLKFHEQLAAGDKRSSSGWLGPVVPRCPWLTWSQTVDMKLPNFMKCFCWI
ncbi:hypothetical protein RHMOL_Rhmol07G0220900 [Rhododendron molle]|uniref:Uncharacterized protein n=1 Tax=Rhododendron molle TaxID=49168 RepID=A0ACC0N3M4_RHOML|nr:hypothetical protein RHMOL_Rhmol07G0220900 [Rhododendron molle]